MPRAGLTPESVVDAAAAIADAHGLDALTLSGLAAALGVRPPSLYAHVSGLEDVQRRLAVRGAAGLADVLAPAAAGRARGDALRAVARAYREWALAHPGQYAAVQFRPIPDAPEARRVVELVISVIRGYGLEGDAAVHAARAVRAALHGFVALEAGGGFGLPLDIDASFEATVAMLDAGLSPPNASPS